MYHGIIFNNSKIKSLQRTGGAYRIATFLRSYGWDIEVIDFAAYWSLEELKEITNSRVKSNTKFIGFSIFFSYWTNDMEFLVSFIQSKFPNIITIIGGQNSQIIKSKVDYFVNGFGEKGLLAILQHHFSNSTQSLKFNPYWLDKGKKVITHNDYPSAPLKSLMTEYQPRDFLKPNEWISIEFARGCIFECKFCSFPILNVKTDHSRDAEDYELQLRTLYDNYGITHYNIVDETLNDSTVKLRKMADVHDKLNFNTYASGFIRADLLVSKSRTEDRELIARIGLFGQFYGLETTNRETGKAIGKGMDPDILLPALLEARDYFKKRGPYRGQCSMIIGLPYETKQSLTKTVKWFIDNWQGDAVNFVPLLLLQNNENYDKTSYLSRNKEKYGYRESSQPLKSLTVKSNEDYEAQAVTGFNWENDHFNFNSAIEMSNKIRDLLVRYNFPMPPFELGRFFYVLDNIKDVVSLDRPGLEKLESKVLENFDKFVDEYKTNKLNWSEK